MSAALSTGNSLANMSTISSFLSAAPAHAADTAHGTLNEVAFQPLSLLRKGESAVVAGMEPAADADQLAVQIRLRELGFVPGEEVRIVAESFPRRDPIAVRLGSTTFALRRHEAAMVRVTLP
jgi:ferrous iron transport protein A